MSSSPSITVTRLDWRDVVLDTVMTPAGPMTITLGLGSGLSRRPADPPGQFWAISDRGPNLKVATAMARYGLDHLAALEGLAGAKIMPCPEIGPTLAALRLVEGRIELIEAFPLADATGRRFTGLPLPGGDTARMEPVFDLAGKPLGDDPLGADSEALVALADGGFWVAEEYGPSLLRVSAEGVVMRRWTPGDLPLIAARRRLNRGFEGLALSADERRLYVAFQSALDLPGEVMVRIWTLDADSGALLAEHDYPFDAPSSFARDAAQGGVGEDDLKVCELVCIGPDQLLVLERMSHTAKIQRVTLGETRRLAKHCLVSTDDWPGIVPDLEGMALLSDRTLILSTDNDFGIEGAETAFYRIDFPVPLTD
jgi:hypothetical protein